MHQSWLGAESCVPQTQMAPEMWGTDEANWREGFWEAVVEFCFGNLKIKRLVLSSIRQDSALPLWVGGGGGGPVGA